MLDIIFENEHFVALNKPAGLLSIPDRVQSAKSLKDLLIDKYGEIFTVHRLDKPTSGLILFAKNATTHKLLSAKFMSRDMQKYYIALVNGFLSPANGRVEAPLAEHPAKNGKMMVHNKGKEAITEYTTLERFRQYALVQYQIFTGRTHQIRVHTQYLGASIACDELYGEGTPLFLSQIKSRYKLSKKEWEERPILQRLALHSYQLKFELYEQMYDLEAPLPKDMRASIVQLRKHNK